MWLRLPDRGSTGPFRCQAGCRWSLDLQPRVPRTRAIRIRVDAMWAYRSAGPSLERGVLCIWLHCLWRDSPDTFGHSATTSPIPRAPDRYRDDCTSSEDILQRPQSRHERGETILDPRGGPAF